MKNIDPNAEINSQKWLSSSIDEETKNIIIKMKEDNIEEFNEAFYRNLEFGTGGLRGIMGIGTNRMNRFTVSMATQGFANYIIKNNPLGEKKVVISFDNRNRSDEFAMITAKVFAANGFKVSIFKELRPTPVLSFAVREMGAIAGVMVTASHNPKEYNGYKAYWNDGGQLTNPHDVLVIEEVNKILDFSQVNIQEDLENISFIDKEIDKIYLEKVLALRIDNSSIQKQKDLKIVYTPLHGTGITMVPKALEMFGFNNIRIVEKQAIIDGNFPTCKSPNPEEASAMELGLELSREIDADILMATDPDADRVGIAVKNNKGEFVLINGNQTATVLTYYILKKYKEENRLKGNEFIIKTIVTSELIKEIANNYNVKSYDVLTGFKYIADKILSLEGKETYICGGEESYGFSIGDFVRDKDAVSTCCLLAEVCAWAKENGKSFYDILIDIYLEYGLYKEDLLSITLKGKSGIEQINSMMNNFRTNPPKNIIGQRIIRIKDYKERLDKDLINNTSEEIHLPISNVLQYYLEDGSRFTVRPSGTEPKIKFYFGVKNKISSREEFAQELEKADNKIQSIIEELGLNKK